MRVRFMSGFATRFKRLSSLEPLVYGCVALGWTLLMARWFYGAMRWQLYNSIAWAQGSEYDPARHPILAGLWSAPLDDVFIHFDFARSTARGFPLQWIDGNGYSSGGTSLLYPFLLALGLMLGFRGLSLMLWAAIIAVTCVTATMLALRRSFEGLPRITSYLLPFAFLGVGALSWSLFSGMEVALFMAIWGAAVVAEDNLVHHVQRAEQFSSLVYLPLALWNFAIVATRPEAVSIVAVLSIAAAWHVSRRRGRAAALIGLLAVSGPAACLILAQAIANKWLTGDFAAAGARVKLEFYNPHLPFGQAVRWYFFYLKYQVLRVTDWHFSDIPHFGWVVWALGAVALLPRRTRAWAQLLWALLLSWIVTVAFNGQVRWQNERYAMPAVAFLLVAAALGAGYLLTWPFRAEHRRRPIAWACCLLAASTLLVYTKSQARCTARQVWFFGRASRNIFDQQLQVGHRLSHLLDPEPHRIAMGDAGAIPYAADMPGLDLIGLGGTNNLPFARAAGWGIGATLELIQRMRREDRPDVFAIYPSWWREFPLWFSDGIIEKATLTARGNVICGGTTKVSYHADFRSLDDAETPLTILPNERVRAALDFGDVVSEGAHDYRISKPWLTRVGMKKLPDPRNPHRDLWDASRMVEAPLMQTFKLRNLRAGRPLRLLFRVAPPSPSQVRIVVATKAIGNLCLVPSDKWEELSATVNAADVTATLSVTLTTIGPTAAELFHLWVVQTND
jgi:hypothetical protein